MKAYKNILACLMIVFSIPLTAANNRTEFENIQTLEAISFAANTVTINGKKFQMAHDIQWLGLEPNIEPSRVVPRILPSQIGFKLGTNSSGSTVIKVIWLFTGDKSR